MTDRSKIILNQIAQDLDVSAELVSRALERALCSDIVTHCIMKEVHFLKTKQIFELTEKGGVYGLLNG